MQWTKPEFEEITLNMEVTAYVNTDDDQPTIENRTAVEETLTVACENAE